MAFEIVDGMTGTKHISSDDLAALNTATVGKADCVLEYGDDFKLTMASANSATLGTGVGMVGGKRFWNQAATSLTIQSGTQGQKRNDLVVARYAKTSAGIESITPVVVKGTPSADTAADPEVTANDLKLWRIPLDGINAGAPVKLFEKVAPLATLGDFVSTKANTGVSYSIKDGREFQNCTTRRGNTIFLTFNCSIHMFGSWEIWNVGTAPIPIGRTFAHGIAFYQTGSTAPVPMDAWVSDTGLISIQNKSELSLDEGWLFVNIVYSCV